MRGPLLALYLRELKLALRRRGDSLLPLGFFALAASLFPLGVGPEPELLRQIGPGVIWVCALLAAMLAAQGLYAGDHADGSLEQLMLSRLPPLGVALAKAAAHWCVSGLPLVVAAPLFGLLFGLPTQALLALSLSLLLGTPVLCLLGGAGAALTVGLRNAGMLLMLIVLPLAVPALIFGTGAVAAVNGGASPAAHFSLLGALLIMSLLLAPPATAAALRIAVE